MTLKRNSKYANRQTMINISAKLIKLGSPVICAAVTYLINGCIMSSVFPSALKRAEITPIYKKENHLSKCNYRPVSVMPCLFTIFEGVIVDQLSEYFEPYFSKYISGFRKGHDCQGVLIRFSESIKLYLDNNNVTAAVLTDLSKAFGCLPYDLLLS